MKHFAFTIFIMLIWQITTAQVKRQYEDGKQSDRTVVVKEQGSDDYDILESQFSDVAVGKVIRITMDKPPKPKPEKKERVVEEKPEKEKVVVAVEPAPVEKKVTVKRTRSASSVSSSNSKRTKKKSRYTKRKKQKRKRYSTKKKYSCYHF